MLRCELKLRTFGGWYVLRLMMQHGVGLRAIWHLRAAGIVADR